ncbi:hypothetical protein BJ322DRAFT_1210521 [Thelephora terrestris]|uniref:RING-type domain-containing protein n=1 Tax=Thelephora terrestris TaxID=56493 RepID=A0A9P6HF66_9AGAM|nr:hypothetical protein BJ322DRAFT_1210521 [Thelephora terrestris]
MSQPSNATTSGHVYDEYEFPDELEGIDWSAVGPIEGDEPKPETTTQVQTQSSVPEENTPSPPTELPPRPSSSSSSYGFPEIDALDEGDLAELDETERLYGLITEEIPGNAPSSSACTLDAIHRPIARLPTADDLILLSSQSSTSCKRKFSSEGGLSSPLKKSKSLPLECAKPSLKGKEIVRDAPVERVIQAVYDSFVETCTCPICFDLFAVPYNIMPCGHTVCGACLCDWVDRSRRDATCPICRQALNNKTSISRNYVVESVMDQQARILTIHMHPGWEPLGAVVLEWTERKTSFQHEASARLARVLTQLGVTPPTPPAPPVNRPARRRRNRGRDRDQVIEIRPFEVVRTRP